MVKKKAPKPQLTIRDKLRSAATRMAWLVSGEIYQEQRQKEKELTDADAQIKDLIDSWREREIRTL